MASEAAIHSVEPEGFDDTARSLQLGQRVGNEGSTPSICDTIVTPIPGEVTFAVNRDVLSEGLVVSDVDVRRAMAIALRELKLVVEPDGAAGLAAALVRPDLVRNVTTLVVVSGGNVDMSLLGAVAGQAEAQTH